MKMWQGLNKVGLDGFVISLLGVIVLAYYVPEPGVQEGLFNLPWLNLAKVANWGVALIFFFYGLKLSPQQFKTGLYHWRLHVVIQSVTFILFPLIILLVKSLVGASWDSLLWVGTFFLATLPSTVSSSVVMVSIAKGNIPSAIFNASLSSLLGVFITPLWMGLILTTAGGGLITAGGGISVGEGFSLGHAVLQLSIQVILPVVLGILLHPRFGSLAIRNSNKLKLFDQTVILLIVYAAFCDSFINNMFQDHTIAQLLLLSLAMITLFFVIYGITAFIGRVLKFNREDNITALFCGSKKSLVHGTVMAKVLFPGVVGIGLILLPLMIFHTLQLVATSIIAQRKSR